MTDNITVNTQSSIRIADGNRVIYADPFRIQGEPHDADIIFITHEHFDHYSTEDIEKVKKDGTVIVVPESMAGKANGAVTIKAGDRTVIGGIEVEAVRAYNKLLPFHPKSAGWVGYILTVGGSRIYIAGDTDATDEAKAVRCDIALVPIGGKFTMDAKAAAALVNTIRPKYAIPTHYGDVVGKPGDGSIFEGLVDASIKVVHKIAFDDR